MNYFTQISKTDWGFIYEVEYGGYKHYEVFKKRLNHRFGTVSYPTDKAFGIWAWTCMTLERVKIRLEALVQAEGGIKDYSITSKGVVLK